MHILLLGAGTVTSRLNMLLAEQGHHMAAQMAAFTPELMDMLDFKGILVVASECTTVLPESLIRAAEVGKAIFVVASSNDGIAAWASGVGVPAFPYPPSDLDVNNLLEEIRRAESGTSSAAEQYRRAVLGGDMAARIQSGMSVRKICVTSPKGGTGKTTLSTNLAVALALCGITTYLVDADANAGAMQYHMRLSAVKSTLMGLMSKDTDSSGSRSVMGQVASGARYLNSFTAIDGLPTLRVLPGLITDDLGDEKLQDEERVRGVIQGLYEAGVASGGVVIMDVGINPAHVVHRAALSGAEGIAIVIKPEIPDMAETNRWIQRMISSVTAQAGRQAAYEYIGSRVKLCYNMVVGDGFNAAHNMLMESLNESLNRDSGGDNRKVLLPINGVLPMVDPRLATHAVNSGRREDILIWRRKRERLEELEPFAAALIGFAANFVPTIFESAERIGLIPSTDGRGKKRKLFGR